jgi:hypothetical protein
MLRRLAVRLVSRHPMIILYAVCLHLVWATTLFLGGQDVIGITAASAIGYYSVWTGVLFLIVALLALIGLGVPSTFLSIVFMLPQQVILALSAEAAVNAMIRGSFADGTIRSHLFIIADQCPALFAAIWHGVALFILAFGGRNG